MAKVLNPKKSVKKKLRIRSRSRLKRLPRRM